MNITQTVDSIKHISQFDDNQKKEMMELTNQMLAVFVDKMNNKKTIDVMNIAVNGIACLIYSLAQTLSPDSDSQLRIIEGINHFAKAYHQVNQIKAKA